MKILSVVGARPNFMKVAPFIRAIREYNDMGTGKEKIIHILVHTGQHYDDRMSKAFFRALSIPDADINLGIGSGSHARQVGLSMIELERVMEKEQPDWVVVYGDVNATLAASVTAKKLHIRVCHVEAGLRSGDMDMPEEVNRLVTDRLSDLLLVPDKLSMDNLQREGVPDSKIVFVGNIMIDTLEANREKASKLSIEEILLSNAFKPDSASFPGKDDRYALLTLHRPSNVDSAETLEAITQMISRRIAAELPVIWAIHPRTEKQLKAFGLWSIVEQTDRIIAVRPLDYHSMLKLNMHATIMLTDSGGLQEECTVLGTPCLTMRNNTERPVTLRKHGGASVLVGNNIEAIEREFHVTLRKKRKPERPELWDGKTAQRCLNAILNHSVTK